MSAQVLHGGKVYLIEFVKQLNVFHYLIQPPYCSSIQTIIMIVILTTWNGLRDFHGSPDCTLRTSAQCICLCSSSKHVPLPHPQENYSCFRALGKINCSLSYILITICTYYDMSIYFCILMIECLNVWGFCLFVCCR